MKKLLFLAFLPIFGLLLSNNCFALQHDYKGFVVGNVLLPDTILDSSNHYTYNWEQSTNSSANERSNSFWFQFPSDYDFLNTSTFSNVGYYLENLNYSYNLINDVCQVLQNTSVPYSFSSNVRLNSSLKRIGFNSHAFPIDKWESINPCLKRISIDFRSYSFATQGVNNFRTINFSGDSRSWASLPGGLGLDFPHNRTNIASADGLRFSESMITHSGITYNGSFSLSRVLQNNNGLAFSKMILPLISYDGYFFDANNLYSGRQFEWKFVFNFKGGVSVNSGSTISLIFDNAREINNNTDVSTSFPCQSELINATTDGESSSTLEVSCPVVLSDSLYSVFPYLNFSSSDVNTTSFFSSWTPNEWEFSSAYFVSDNDYTPGASFNSDLHGSMWSLMNGSDYADSLDPDWLTSLKNLFNFSLPNTPLGLIFGSFNNDNCANIPIIAGMIHSEESQVCPWFSAETRAITTPVLALFSGFLIFGFFMRWLGSSSGNFVEDSSTHESGNFTIKKRGK